MKYELKRITIIRKIEVNTRRLIISKTLNQYDFTKNKKACVCYVCKQKKKAKIKIRASNIYLNICATCFKKIA